LLSGDVLLSHEDGRDRIITAGYHWLPIVQFDCKNFNAKALTDCSLLKVKRKKLDELLTWSQIADYLEVDISYERERDDDVAWMTTILNSNLFYKVAPIKIHDIFSKIEELPVSEGEVVIRQGDLGDYCYFIKEGRAEVLRSECAGDEQKIAEIREGRCFGEDALIKQTVRNASVKMLSDGTLIRLAGDDFASLIEPPSEALFKILPLQDIDLDEVVFLDVRSQEEYDYKHMKGAKHIPLNLLRLKIRVLNKNQRYIVYCNTSRRSQAAAYLLAKKGFDVAVLEGGLHPLTLGDVNDLLIPEENALGYSTKISL